MEQVIKKVFRAEYTFITQTSHIGSGNNAFINVGWDTNQLISCVFTAFVILIASVLIPSIKIVTRLESGALIFCAIAYAGLNTMNYVLALIEYDGNIAHWISLY